MNRGEAAAPPASEEKTADSNGAGGRLVKAWLDGYKGRFGRDYGRGGVGKLSGVLSRMLKDFDEATLSQAIAAYFAEDRRTYGAGIFEIKMQDGDRDLLPRPEQSPPRDEYSERTLAKMGGQRP